MVNRKNGEKPKNLGAAEPISIKALFGRNGIEVRWEENRESEGFSDGTLSP